MALPSPAIRSAIADAVHQAVVDVTDSDGVGHCGLYTLAGYDLLPLVTGLKFQPQVGTFSALIDPPDGWFVFDATGDGFARGEYHSWLACPTVAVDEPALGGPGPVARARGQIVDFSIRNLRATVNRTPQVSSAVLRGDIVVAKIAEDQIPYNLPHDPPPYLWCEDKWPPGFSYVPVAEAITSFVNRVATIAPMIKRLLPAARLHYRKAARRYDLPMI